jgi:hypothetical protein
MNILKPLAIAAALAAVVTPVKAQVSGGFAFQMPIYNSSGEAVFNGIPAGRDTQVYDFKGKYIGRVTAKAFIDGLVVSLLDLHIGCTDVRSAEVALIAPNSADRTKCDLLAPSRPYEIIEDRSMTMVGPNAPSVLCLRPWKTETACRWVFMYLQTLYTDLSPATKALEVGDTFQISPKAAPEYRANNLWTCDTLEKLRSGNHDTCGAPASRQTFEVVEKSGDAVCYRNAGRQNESCHWAVLAPTVVVGVRSAREQR